MIATQSRGKRSRRTCFCFPAHAVEGPAFTVAFAFRVIVAERGPAFLLPVPYPLIPAFTIAVDPLGTVH
jgi:hypothetical protein